MWVIGVVWAWIITFLILKDALFWDVMPCGSSVTLEAVSLNKTVQMAPSGK
jgi:hypothetical protein